MIYYDPTSGDPTTAPITSRPRSCFLMTQMGGDVDPALLEMREVVEDVLRTHDFAVIDADSRITGRDFLRRAYLVSGENLYREKAREYFSSAGLESRARNSVEVLLAQF